jgi:ankyrin repeat protein
MLQGIDPEYQKQVASVLKWLAFSIRPLLLDELAEVFILDHEKDVPFDENDRLFTVEEVLTYLPRLVTEVPTFNYYGYRSVRNGTNVTEIRFAHFSIKEYLSSSRICWEYYSTPEQTTHLHISECCLAYHLQLSESITVTEDNLRRYTLWKYAAQYLASHLEKVALQSWTVSVTNRVKRMFASRSQSLLNMVRIGSHDGEWRRDWKITPDKLASPLYYAVSMGAFQLTSLLIHNNADINEAPPTASDDTILQGAIYRKHKAIIKLLLEHNADVNAQGGYYGNALQEAAIAGDLEVVRLLLDNGTTINPQGRCREERCVGQVPLRSGAQVNAEGGCLGTALQAAAVFGKLDILQLLLDRGADINTKGGRYGTALQAAASRGYLDILQVLFDNGADVNAKGGSYGNALQAAVARDRLDIVEVILARGANIDPPGLEWEQLIARVRKNRGDQGADRLRKLQEDPTGYIEWRRRREREEDGENRGQIILRNG